MPNPECPIIFDDIKGECQVDKQGSSYNLEETNAVIKYVKILLGWSGKKIQLCHMGKHFIYSFKIVSLSYCCCQYHLFFIYSKHSLPFAIGIISPYRAQCRMLEVACQQNKIVTGTSGVAIGTAEQFQGQERPIIIISTVRTNDNLGFTNDERVSSTHFLRVQVDRFSN